jgi:hypothetical protein
MDLVTSQIQPLATLESFFQELLEEALAAEQVDLDHASRAYLLHLLAEFAQKEALHAHQPSDDPGTPMLVSLYARARETAPSQRFEAYRHMGDVALMVSGLFAPHVERSRSLVGIDYYVQMGAAAYDQAATLAKRSGFDRLLAELAAKFRRLVEVLMRVAEQTTLPSLSDVGALYTRLMRSPESRALHQRLAAQGLAPVLVGKAWA